jgi:L-histidine N-alpha-methyltransferase
MLTGTATQTYVSEFALDVRLGLTKKGQKEIPSKYLYDEIGSALFEVITLLPEYGLCRADERLVRASAEAISEIFLSESMIVAELGSGSGKKTAYLLEALAWRQRAVYSPIEISGKALDQCAKELGHIPNVDIHAIQEPYLQGLAAVAKKRQLGECILVLFLGSTIGNFERCEAERFLVQVRQMLSAGDALLLGTDLEKPGSQLLPAYDDAIGVTAAFNLNLLARMNRELDADFDMTHFRHLARYNAEERRIEMHLISTRPQTVDIPRSHCRVSFAENETIWTESSHKYRCDEVVQMGTSSGFRLSKQWTDLEWDFAETLLIAQ